MSNIASLINILNMKLFGRWGGLSFLFVYFFLSSIFITAMLVMLLTILVVQAI